MSSYRQRVPLQNPYLAPSAAQFGLPLTQVEVDEAVHQWDIGGHLLLGLYRVRLNERHGRHRVSYDALVHMVQAEILRTNRYCSTFNPNGVKPVDLTVPTDDD